MSVHFQVGSMRESEGGCALDGTDGISREGKKLRPQEDDGSEAQIHKLLIQKQPGACDSRSLELET